VSKLGNKVDLIVVLVRVSILAALHLVTLIAEGRKNIRRAHRSVVAHRKQFVEACRAGLAVCLLFMGIGGAVRLSARASMFHPRHQEPKSHPILPPVAATQERSGRDRERRMMNRLRYQLLETHPKERQKKESSVEVKQRARESQPAIRSSVHTVLPSLPAIPD
jgi:hypothetical protein